MAITKRTKTIYKKLKIEQHEPQFTYLFQAVYGVFSSIEGCAAFQDCLRLTKIGKWYYRMKDACDNHHGNLSSHKQ